jgi:hypothetical protein
MCHAHGKLMLKNILEGFQSFSIIYKKLKKVAVGSIATAKCPSTIIKGYLHGKIIGNGTCTFQRMSVAMTSFQDLWHRKHCTLYLLLPMMHSSLPGDSKL